MTFNQSFYTYYFEKKNAFKYIHFLGRYKVRASPRDLQHFFKSLIVLRLL